MMENNKIYVMNEKGVTYGPFNTVRQAFNAVQESYKDQHTVFTPGNWIVKVIQQQDGICIVEKRMYLDNFIFKGHFNEPDKVDEANLKAELDNLKSADSIQGAYDLLTENATWLLVNTCEQMVDENGIYEIDLGDHKIVATTDSEVLITGLTFNVADNQMPAILTENVHTGICGNIGADEAELADILYVLGYMEIARKNSNYPKGRLVLCSDYVENFVKETIKSHYGDRLPDDWEQQAIATYNTLTSDFRGMPLDAALVIANL